MGVLVMVDGEVNTGLLLIYDEFKAEGERIYCSISAPFYGLFTLHFSLWIAYDIIFNILMKTLLN